MSKLIVNVYKSSIDIFYALCCFVLVVAFFSLYFNHYGLFQLTIITMGFVYLINHLLFCYIMNKYRLSYRKLLITYSELKTIREVLKEYKI